MVFTAFQVLLLLLECLQWQIPIKASGRANGGYVCSTIKSLMWSLKVSNIFSSIWIFCPCSHLVWLLGDVTRRLCTAAEIKFYFNSFLERESSKAQFLRPNKNCNLTSWVPGCESGWASTVASNVKVELKNSKDMPERILDSQPCCAGFFCPQGITCMIRKSTSSVSIIGACIYLWHANV